jgi:hypothetical protein
MERSLLWSAIGIGCAGWLCGVLLTGKQQPAPEGGRAEGIKVPRAFLLTALALPLLIFLLTLPSTPPFAAGQGWGRGFLLGGAGALLAAWSVLRVPFIKSYLPAAAVVIAPYSLALIVVAVPLLSMRTTIIDTLAGVAIGWFVVSFVLYVGLAEVISWRASEAVPSESSEGMRAPDKVVEPFDTPLPRHLATALSRHLILVTGIGFAVTLCAVAALGVYRDFITPGIPRGTWSAIAVAFACGVPLALLLSGLLARFLRCAPSRVPSFVPSSSGHGEATSSTQFSISAILVSLVLLLVLGNLLSTRVIEQPRVLYVIGVGFIAGLLIWWMVGIAEARSRLGTAMMTASPPATLVVLGAFMVSFQMLQGFGVGLMLLALWTIAGLAMSVADEGVQKARSDEAPDVTAPTSSPIVPSPVRLLMLVRALLFGVLLLLYRLLETRFRADLRGVTLTDHYAFFGFLVGAMLPALLVGSLSRPASVVAARPGAQAARLILAGALTLAAPAIMLTLWGAKIALALLAGLAISAAGDQWQASGERRSGLIAHYPSLLTPLFALAVALALAQWTHHILPLAELSRAERIRMLTWVVVGLMALLIAADYGSRLLGWAQKRKWRNERTSGEDVTK